MPLFDYVHSYFPNPLVEPSVNFPTFFARDALHSPHRRVSMLLFYLVDRR